MKEKKGFDNKIPKILQIPLKCFIVSNIALEYKKFLFIFKSMKIVVFSAILSESKGKFLSKSKFW
jgi:hypothetical protein